MELAKTRPVVVITGARQTGKTSLLKHCFPNHNWVSLDLPLIADEAENNPEAFLKAHPEPLIIDEIQYAPKLFRYIKLYVDKNRGQNGRFFLTGSQKFSLMEGVSDSLAGRASILDLETLSIAEIQGASTKVPEKDRSIEQILLRGGFPELYEKPELDPSDFYHSYLSTYLERDVRSLINIGKLRDFERFIRSCALRSGQLLNQSDLARDVGIGPSTAGEWLSALQASNQVSLLEPWFSNKQKGMTKSPKLYIKDTGLLLFLLGIQTASELHKSPFRGAIWETFVCSELRKLRTEKRASPNLFFYRDRAKEVDFMIDRGGRFELLEAKWNENPSSKDCESLLAVEEDLGPKSILSKRIVCRTSATRTLHNGIVAVPVEKLSTIEVKQK